MTKERNSSIELFKIIGMLLIVVSHLTQSLIIDSPTANLIPQIYSIEIGNTTTSINLIILTFFRTLGLLGNYIFLIPSCWFLIEKQKNNKAKIASLIGNQWVISILILSVCILLTRSIANRDILLSMLPLTFGNNWYITAYVLLLFCYPIFNIIINHLDKKQLLELNIFLIIVYFGINFIKFNLLFINEFSLFIVIYFLIAYIKKYLQNFANNKRINILIFIFCGLLFLLNIPIMNFISMHISFFHNKLLRFSTSTNIVYFLLAMSLFNLLRNKKTYSFLINMISSVTLYIYLFHENLIFKKYFRWKFFEFIYNNYGYKHIVLYTLLGSLLLFFISIIIGIIYKNTIKRIVDTIINKIYINICKIYNKISLEILKIN